MPNEHDQLVERILRDLRVLTRGSPDDHTASGIRAIMDRPEVRRALERANDIAACFALREVKHILADRRQSPSAAIARIGSIVNEFSRSAQQSAHKSFWWKKPSAR
jgi:hypothetical protein